MASKKTNPPTIEELKTLFRYEPETGHLYWLETGCGRPTGKPAGTKTYNGYISVVINRRPYLAHRIAWALHHGAWPKECLDHVNGDTTDNRLVNLREATHAQNSKNMGFNKANTSGAKGVIFDKARRKWRAQINVDGKFTVLGRYENFDDAVAARKVAEEKHFGEWKRGNPCA